MGTLIKAPHPPGTRVVTLSLTQDPSAKPMSVPNQPPQRRFFRPNLAPRRVKVLGGWSLQVRTALSATGLFLFFGAITALLSAFLINDLKNELVSVAHDEVRLVGEEARREIERVLADAQAGSLSDIANDPSVRAQLKIMSREGGVVLAAMIDSDGNCILQQYGDDGALKSCPERHGDTLSGVLAGGDLAWEMQLRSLPAGVQSERIPIMKAGAPVGYLEYGISDTAALGRLEPISRAISNGLFIMAGLVAGFLGLSVLLLARLSQRHVALQRQHDEAQRMATIGAMASGLAHEIRNPLHAMNLHLEAARDELQDPRDESPQRVQRVISSVQRQIGALNDIVTNFMRFALPGRIETEPMALGAMVAEVVTMISPEIDERGVRVTRSVPEDAWIDADPTAARQVLTNVLLNACQILDGRERREVTIAASRAADGWIVTLDDTGPGIPEGLEATIFDAFVSHRKGGTGFGLAIARRLMEDQGGAISASNLPGGGARFTLRFRAATPQPPAAPRPSAAAGPAADDEPLTIG